MNDEFVNGSSVPVRHNLRWDEKKINSEVGRFTAFTFIFWDQDDHEDPISSKIYWRDYLFTFLSSIKVPSAVSPCHDQDINEVNSVTGEVEFKKVHWHVVIDFGSGQNKTIKQIYDLIRPIRKYISIAPWDECIWDYNEILNDFDLSSNILDSDDDQFNKVKKVWMCSNAVRNMRSLLRYFKHLDNPEKHQYSDSIQSFGGFEVEDRIYSQTDSYFILDQIFDFIEEQHLYSYWKLLKYCRKNNREWYAVLCKNMYSHMIINAQKSFAVEDTGYLDRKIERYEKGNDD